MTSNDQRIAKCAVDFEKGEDHRPPPRKVTALDLKAVIL
jgi:hypothetical protein